MIAKSVLATFVSSLLLVLVPLAALAGAAVLGIMVAVFWMSAVHGLVVRLDDRDGVQARASRATRDDGLGEL